MIRVVLDTNIIVSALLQPLGPPAQVFVLAIGGTQIVTARRLLDIVSAGTEEVPTST